MELGLDTLANTIIIRYLRNTSHTLNIPLASHYFWHFIKYIAKYLLSLSLSYLKLSDRDWMSMHA